MYFERANPDLIEALRRTAARLATGAEYRWTHMGSCNCGHLAQTVTELCRERDDVVVYLRAWADLLEEEWMTGTEVPGELPGPILAGLG